MTPFFLLHFFNVHAKFQKKFYSYVEQFQGNYTYTVVFISDPLIADSDIRFCVLSSLDERFDAHLAQAENLSALFVALNDEVKINYYQLKVVL